MLGLMDMLDSITAPPATAKVTVAVLLEPTSVGWKITLLGVTLADEAAIPDRLGLLK